METPQVKQYAVLVYRTTSYGGLWIVDSFQDSRGKAVEEVIRLEKQTHRVCMAQTINCV